MGLLPRVKVWSSTEDVTASDLNAEFNNILDNFDPAYVNDYSANVSQMQVTTDPGEVGTESLATTLRGELERLRFMLKEITGKNQWYETPVASLAGLANVVGTGLTSNRIVSGRVRATSAQPIFLVPNGAAKTVKLDGTPTNFLYYVDGVEYTISSDVTLTGLTAAPSSNNTCLVNIANATAQDFTKYLGENGTEIAVDNMGSEITALVGKFVALKTSTEVLYAYVASTTSLTKCRRGYFFDSTDAPLVRVGLTDNDSLALLKLTWIFAKTDGTLTATYNNPVYSDDEPTSPAIGDYWFDTSANQWKVYSVGSFSAAGATLVGICAQDTTNCIAARSFDAFGNYASLNTIELYPESNSQTKSRWPGANINVYGTTQHYDQGLVTWDMTLDLDSGVTESASVTYFFYITETGDKIISNVRPYDRAEDLLGFYHPHQSWRCIGQAFNNASQNLEQVESIFKRYGGQALRSVISTDTQFPTDQTQVLTGASFTVNLLPAAFTKGRIYRFIHGGVSLSQVYTLDGFSTETIGGATTVKMHTFGQILDIMSDGSNHLILNSRTNTGWVSAGTVTIGATTSAPAKATGITIDRWLWKREGQDLVGRFEYQQSNATSATTGTGDYLILAVPSGATIDTALVTPITTVEGQSIFLASNVVGSCFIANSTTDSMGVVVVYDTTQVRFEGITVSAEGAWSAGYFPLNGTTVGAAAEWRVPITDWLP